LQPTGVGYEQGRKNRIAREQTTAAIKAEVAAISDIAPVDPIQARRDELAQKMKWAAGAEKNALRERIRVRDDHLKVKAAEAAEAKRLEQFGQHPAVQNMREAATATLRNATTLYPGVDPTKFERLATIANNKDFACPLHASRVFFEALADIENDQFAADNAKHREALLATGQQFGALNTAEAAAAASKARLDAAKAQLGGDDVQQDSE